MPRPKPVSSADQTRTALLHAGLRLFGRQGYQGTSTRELASLARVNIASIAYHFGGKKGLHLACADFIAETIQAVARPALADAEAANDPETAAQRLGQSIERMVSFFVASPEVGDFAQFVLRELAAPGPALDRLYEGAFRPTHERLCRIWEQATGDPADGDETKLRIFTMFGQVVYFKIAREAVTRRMGWADIGPGQAGLIASVITGNVTAILASRKHTSA